MIYGNSGRAGAIAGLPTSKELGWRFHLATPEWLKLIGPGFVISIGYINPGNWATDIAAGAYGYRLLWVLIVASTLAVLLQCAVVRLALICQEDLATMIARRWSKAAPALGIVYAAAILATDLAEFAGIAVGLQLIFDLSIAMAALIGLLGMTLVFVFGAGSIRKLERCLIGLLWLVAVAVVFQLRDLHPSIWQIGTGLVVPRLPDRAAILVAVGLIGATVMPHNLFLHSLLVVENCKSGVSKSGLRRRYGYFARETFWALLIATLINGAIVVVSVANNAIGSSFGETFAQIHLYAGNSAALMFGSALALSGLAAAVTATWSADCVIASFSPIRVSPLLRRAGTALPACALMAFGIDPLKLMIGSQVILALVLPAIVLPLVRLMVSEGTGALHFSRGWLIASGLAAIICVSFDIILLGSCFIS